jgi:TetR/AcrR family transcriptional regulator, cholesterol catabolism regulator
MPLTSCLHMSHFIADHLKSVNPSFSYDLKKYYSRVWDELVEFKSKTVFEHIMANIRKGVREGLYRKDLNYEIIAYVYVARMELYSPGGLPELQNFLPGGFSHAFSISRQGHCQRKRSSIS